MYNDEEMTGTILETLPNGDTRVQVTNDNWEIAAGEPGGIITLPKGGKFEKVADSDEPERPSPSPEPKRPGKPPNQTKNTVPVGSWQPDIVAKVVLLSIGAGILYQNSK